MDNYEKVLLETILNAGEKLIDSATLHGTGYSYRSSWCLAVIAEEELAKLVILPFAKMAGTLESLSQRPSIVYSHPMKQKIFTTYGLQNRSHERIEELKQSYLYMKPDTGNYEPMPVVTAEEAEAEILHAVLLFDRLAVLNFLSSSLLSQEFKNKLKWYYENVYIPAIRSLSPSIEAAMRQRYDDESRPSVLEIVQGHPLIFAEVVQAALPDRYQDYFAEIEGLSFDAAIQKLQRYLGGNDISSIFPQN